MNILLTNDDGFQAPGIEILESILKSYGTVYVVAPQQGKSGASSSLTINRWINLKKIDDFHYAVDGNPVDCVIYGLNALNVKFDLVVSGCNNGYNLSFDSIYSGTVGACFQALVGRIPTIAFSADYNHFSNLKQEIPSIMEYIFSHHLLSNQYLLNVNLPIAKYETSKGICFTRQYHRQIVYQCKQDQDQILLSRKELIQPTQSLEDDVYAVQQGYVSITPLQMTRFSESLYQELLLKIKDSVDNLN